MDDTCLAAVLGYLDRESFVSTAELVALVPGSDWDSMHDQMARLEADGRIWRMRSGCRWFWAAKTSGGTP